jgi:hypothetical protein
MAIPTAMSRAALTASHAWSGGLSPGPPGIPKPAAAGVGSMRYGDPMRIVASASEGIGHTRDRARVSHAD